MDVLNTKIKNILAEKVTKITPENIKKDVKILGITGNYEGESNDTNVLMDDTLNYQGNFGGYELITKVTSLDTSNFSTTKNLFNGLSELIEVPQQLVTNQVTDMQYMFNGCKKLTFIPQMDTSRVTNMYYMFTSCAKLTTVPLLNTSKVTNMTNMFSGCPALSNESLNNILQMCINAAAYTSTKTLTILGFRAYQHSQAKIEALSNYQAFLDAGWTIGY
jgi:surface protein